MSSEHDFKSIDDNKLIVIRKALKIIKDYPEHWRKFKNNSYEKNAFALQTKSSTFRDRILEQLVEEPPHTMGEFNMAIMGQRGIMQSEKMLDYFYYRAIMFGKFHDSIGRKPK